MGSPSCMYINYAMTISMTASLNGVPIQIILPRKGNEGKSGGVLLSLHSLVQVRSSQLGPLTQSSRYMYQASQHGTSLTTMASDADSAGNSSLSSKYQQLNNPIQPMPFFKTAISIINL